jgi:hypothetical protein
MLAPGAEPVVWAWVNRITSAIYAGNLTVPLQRGVSPSGTPELRQRDEVSGEDTLCV